MSVRDRLDRRDEEEHAEADHFPDDRDDHRPEGALGVLAEPDDRLVDDTEVQEPLVDQPIVVAEQPVPKQARHAEPDDHRHEDNAAGDPARAAYWCDEESDEIAADHQDRRQVERVFEGEAERHPELVVVPGLDVIGGSDPSRRLDDRPVVERHPDHLAERIGGEDRDEQECGREVQNAQHLAASGRIHSGSRSGSRT